MTADDFKNLAVPGSHAHLVGIGGVSMSPLAEVLLGMGLVVTGSDINEGPTVEHLRSLGISVQIGHYAENIDGADFLVRTAAVHDGNPEIAAARRAGIPVFERTQAWGSMMRAYKNAVCVSGTHGKTTTTSMITHILTEAERDPTVMIGGTLPLLNSGYRVGKGDDIVMESCEYYNSFLSFFPTVAIILNVDADHLDFFKDINDIKASFRAFAQLVPESGYVIANSDDPNTISALTSLGRPVLTFGFGSGAIVRGEVVEIHDFGSTFNVTYRGKPYARIVLNIPGKHNISNALAAVAASIVLGIDPECAVRGLEAFHGAGRRFEYVGMLNGARVYDDYAHHPRELHVLLDAAAEIGAKRVIVAFQPHTYSRTKALFDDFVRELKRPDKVFLAEIYAAREDNEEGIYSKDLAEKIPGAVVCETFAEMEESLREEAREGDVILTVGAGDIYKVGRAIASK